MAFAEPSSMEEVVYFTRRTIPGAKEGKVMAWAPREKCPKCKKAMMGKPRDPKTGAVKMRAKEYVCPDCKYTVPKQEYEDTLTCYIKYTCQHCGSAGETSVPFTRKSFEGVKAVVFQCNSCKQKIPITKKMKAVGKTEAEVPEE